MVSQSSVVHVVWPLSIGTLSLSENQTGQEPTREIKTGKERGREQRRREGERDQGGVKAERREEGRGGEIPTSRNILLEVIKSWGGE